MKKTVVASLIVIVSLAFAVFCAGCTSSTTPSPSPGSTTAVAGNGTALGNATVIDVMQGQNFTMQLQSNPSTGYHWELEYTNATLRLVNETFASNVSTSNTSVVGAGGTELYTFRATETGTGSIVLSDVSPANQTVNTVPYSVLITS